LVSDDAQRSFIPDFDGQPSAIAAWLDPDVNRRWNGFYKNTFATIRDAWIRPRHTGYIEFQSEGSAIIRGGLSKGESITKVLQLLQDAYARHCLFKNPFDLHRKT
jgi:multiple sugar transport system substrate-binding protein